MRKCNIFPIFPIADKLGGSVWIESAQPVSRSRHRRSYPARSVGYDVIPLSFVANVTKWVNGTGLFFGKIPRETAAEPCYKEAGEASAGRAGSGGIPVLRRKGSKDVVRIVQ
jgi:hypothetical protein